MAKIGDYIIPEGDDPEGLVAGGMLDWITTTASAIGKTVNGDFSIAGSMADINEARAKGVRTKRGQVISKQVVVDVGEHDQPQVERLGWRKRR